MDENTQKSPGFLFRDTSYVHRYHFSGFQRVRSASLRFVKKLGNSSSTYLKLEQHRFKRTSLPASESGGAFWTVVIRASWTWRRALAF